MTNTTPHGQVPAIQRYKIGYHSDEWGVRSSTPSGIPDASGSWVRYEDHAAELRRLHAAHQHANGNVALLADILNRRPAMSAGLVEAYAAWTAEVYDLMGAMAAEPANDSASATSASHGQAPAQEAPAAVAGPLNELGDIAMFTTPAQRGELAGDGKPCNNDHDPDCRWPDCLCRTREAAARAAQDGGDVAMTTTQGEHAQPEALRGAPPSAYSQEDRAFYTFWYGHMLNDLMQTPLAGVSHSTARYIWDAAIAHAAAPAQAADSVLEDAERYRWLRQEHERVDPVCHLTWKRNLQRDSSEWVNTAVLDTAIDNARKQGANHD